VNRAQSAPELEPPAPLREADLFGLAPAKLLEAARDYVLLGRVHRPRRCGGLLAAEIEGTDDTYPVRATLDAVDGTLQISPVCPCPSQRPYCKHVLALLWQWVDDRGSFLQVDGWRLALQNRPVPELADLLADVAMGIADPLALVEGSLTPDWEALTPGQCLERWDQFRASQRDAGRWPEAALALGLRITGPLEQPVSAPSAQAAITARQLAWWLSLVVAELPAPALVPWLRHLEQRLEAADPRDGAALPPELGVWIGRLAVALPAERAAERRWLARFAAGRETLAPVCEAELQRLRWGDEVAVRVAVAPATVAARDAASVAGRCQDALEAMRAEDRHSAQAPTA
jgi:hypothetical protein